MTRVTIYAREKKDQNNLDLCDWLDKNFDQLVKGGITFDFRVISNDDEKRLAKSDGVEHTPAIKDDRGELFYGVGNIKKRLQTLYNVKTGRRTAPASPEDSIRNWQMTEMSKAAMDREKKEPTEEESIEKTKRKAEQDWIARQKKHAQQSKVNHPVQGQPQSQSGRGDNVKVDYNLPSRSQSKPQGGGTGSSDIFKAIEPGNKDDLMLARMLETT